MVQRLAKAEKAVQREQEAQEHQISRKRQRVKRYENGDKYDGEVRMDKTTSIPHGHVRCEILMIESVS